MTNPKIQAASDELIEEFFPQSTPRRQLEWATIKARIDADREEIAAHRLRRSEEAAKEAADRLERPLAPIALPPRAVYQILLDAGRVLALCHDGTVWTLIIGNEWSRLPAIPQDGVEPKP